MIAKWTTGIVSLAVGILDYGDSFNQQERYDYKIIAYTKDGTINIFPGLYENKKKAKHHLKELATKIIEINQEICSTKKDIQLNISESNNHCNILRNRRMRNSAVRNIKRLQRLKDNGVIN